MDYTKIEKLVAKNLNNTIDRCWFGKTYEQIKELETKGMIYTGKVRDSFQLQDGARAIVVADSVSAFDIVADRKIPFKGQILNQTSNHWFQQTKNIIQNHFIESPHPNVSIVRQCVPEGIELVVRGYLTGSGWRDYETGKFEQKYGIKLPENLKKNQKLDEPIVTPTTKAPRGQHDAPIWPDKAAEIVGSKIKYAEIQEIGLKLFEHGTQMMKRYDCIFVDTKYEFGQHKEMNELLIDEINTSDSSRFWRESTYEELWQTPAGPEAFDKEVLRQWQIEKGRKADAGAEVPLISLEDEIVKKLAVGYTINYQNVTGKLPKTIKKDALADIEGILLERGLMTPTA